MSTQTYLETQAAPIAAHASDAFTRDIEPMLIAQARDGSSDAIGQLLKRYERRVLHMAKNITDNHEDAEEAVQNAFVKAYLNLATFRGDSRFYTWLARITINEALMKVRGRRHKAKEVSIDEADNEKGAIVAQELEDGKLNPEELYSQEELRRILTTTIDALDARSRNVFQLRNVEGFSTEQTAQALALSSSAVKTRLRRARIRLRNSLGVQLRRPAARAMNASS